jgi:N-acetylneuraminate synthase
LYAQLEISLSELDVTGVEVIPQTMPPFPWHFGGQQFHNLFVRSEEIVDFCKRHQMRVCLDVSHSKLATNFLNQSFGDFLRQVAPFTAHMHLADADGFDGEGLQVGEGGIDWLEFSQIMHELNPTAHFIPEIWQGHKSQGAGAWLALERLEALLGEVA